MKKEEPFIDQNGRIVANWLISLSHLFNHRPHIGSRTGRFLYLVRTSYLPRCLCDYRRYESEGRRALALSAEH